MILLFNLDSINKELVTKIAKLARLWMDSGKIM